MRHRLEAYGDPLGRQVALVVEGLAGAIVYSYYPAWPGAEGPPTPDAATLTWHSRLPWDNPADEPRTCNVLSGALCFDAGLPGASIHREGAEAFAVFEADGLAGIWDHLDRRYRHYARKTLLNTHRDLRKGPKK